MKHNGVQYRIMETPNPTGWIWSVELVAGRKKTGVAQTKEVAIFHAVHVIDKVLDMEPKTTPKMVLRTKCGLTPAA
jgi:hypothetical protein